MMKYINRQTAIILKNVKNTRKPRKKIQKNAEFCEKEYEIWLIDAGEKIMFIISSFLRSGDGRFLQTRHQTGFHCEGKR